MAEDKKYYLRGAEASGKKVSLTKADGLMLFVGGAVAAVCVGFTLGLISSPNTREDENIKSHLATNAVYCPDLMREYEKGYLKEFGFEPGFCNSIECANVDLKRDGTYYTVVKCNGTTRSEEKLIEKGDKGMTSSRFSLETKVLRLDTQFVY